MAIETPAMQRLLLNPLGIPTGAQESFAGLDAELGESKFDDCFETMKRSPTFILSGAGLRIAVEFLEGYRYAQIFAPKDKDFIAIDTDDSTDERTGERPWVIPNCTRWSIPGDVPYRRPGRTVALRAGDILMNIYDTREGARLLENEKA